MTTHVAASSAPASASASDQSYRTLRLPRGLLEDLEESVIQFDRQFLTEVGLSLGLSRAAIAPMIRQILGTGAPQNILTLWTPPVTDTDTDTNLLFCPWWECHGGNLWRRCPRHRLSPSLPCCIHERAVPCPLTRLGTDPELLALPLLQPIEYDNRIFWVGPDGTPCYAEDGTVPTDGVIRFATDNGERVPLFVPYAALARMNPS